MSAAKKFGWKLSTYAAHENGQNGYKPDNAIRYAKALKTTASWLLTGEGAAPERQKKSLVKSFDPDETERFPDSASAEAENIVFPPDAIRELQAKGGMGAGQVIEATFRRDGQEITTHDAVKDDYWRFPPSFVRSLGARAANLLVIECQGDSMSPTLQAGERVWVDTGHRLPSPDGIYAIRDPFEQVIVKRLELTADTPPRIAVLSDNQMHGRKIYALEDVAVVGKVLCSLRML